MYDTIDLVPSQDQAINDTHGCVVKEKKSLKTFKKNVDKDVNV